MNCVMYVIQSCPPFSANSDSDNQIVKYVPICVDVLAPIASNDERYGK